MLNIFVSAGCVLGMNGSTANIHCLKWYFSCGDVS